MRTLGALVVTAACALASPASHASAQDQETGAVSVSANASASPRVTSSRSSRQGPLRIYGGLHFGGGGEYKVDFDGPGDGDIDLDPQVGLQAGADYVLMKYFAIGGELRLTWWKPEEVLNQSVDRSMFFDIDVKPRGRYEFSNIPLEVYGTMPMGLSIAALNDDMGMDGGAGFNLGFGGGATYFFTSMIGVNLEMLGVWHWFDGELNGIVMDVDSDNKTAQFYLFANAVFAL
jgi:hypothetical protein